MRISDWSSDVCSSDLGPLPGLQQHRLAVRRRPSALAPPPRHVGELEADHAPAVGGEAGGEEAHEGCVHRRAGAVGEGEGERRRSGRGRKSVGEGEGVSVSVDLGGGRILKKKKNEKI